MPKRAWAYIGTVLFAGGVISVLSMLQLQPHLRQHPAELLTFGTLAVLATGAQLYKAEAPDNSAFYATPVFFFAGVLLLDVYLFVLLVAVAHLVEWTRERWTNGDSLHLRAWYIQPFNIAMYIIAGCCARYVYLLLTPDISSLLSLSTSLAGAIAVIVYAFVNNALLGEALILARGLTWRELDVLTVKNLLPELIMLCLGFIVAALWSLAPWLILPALLPLVLMYQALTIPLLKQEAQTDGKTGLLNARYFNKLFTDELARAHRFDRPLAVIMADLDLLRNINNTYGHLAGDTVLANIGQIIRRTIRDYDLAGRFGGEEFAIVLPEAGPVEAYALANRVRSTIQEATHSIATSATPIHATMSLGVACFPQDATNLTDLIHEADVAVYQAKLQGRNRVVCASEVPHSIKVEHATPPAKRMPAQDVAASVASAGVAVSVKTKTDQTPVDNTSLASTSSNHGSEQGNSAPSTSIHAAQTRPGVNAAVHSYAEATQGTEEPQRMSRLLRGFLVIVCGAGILATFVGSALSPTPDLIAIGLLALLTVLAEIVQVNVYGANTISVSMAATFAAALIGGMPGVAAISAAIALTHHLRQRRPLRHGYKTAFNWATHVLAGTAPVVVTMLQPLALGGTQLPVLALLSLFAAIAYYLVESWLISAAIALSTGDRIPVTWRAQFRWLLGHYVVLGVLGLFLAVAYIALGVAGLAVFTLPVAMMHYAQRQYVERTEDSMRELKRMNQELEQANTAIISASQSIQLLNAELKDLNEELFVVVGRILDARDPYVGGHSAKVAEYATAIALEVGLAPEHVELVRQAGFLHDIGKIAISEQILNKPTRLTDDEYEYVKSHAAIGADLIETSRGLHHLAPFVRHHHERWDGRGYPDALVGEQIPLEARILNVCDSVEAMASDRPYHQGMALSEIIEEVRRCAGTQFDPVLADAFIRIAQREGEHLVTNSAIEVVRKHGEHGDLVAEGTHWFPQTLHAVHT